MPAEIALDIFAASQPCVVDADADRLQRAIHHLLRNAANAMADGGTIATTVVVDTDHVRVSVADQGVGMSNEQITNAFRPFRRTNRGNGGAGLGLAVVWTIIGQHGGSVCASSRGAGCGSTVTFSLPVMRD